MQGTYLRDEISKAGRVTRGVLQGVLQGACYKILTRGVLQNDLLRRVKLSNLTTHNFHACRQGSVTWGMLRRASYQGRATKGMYTRFLPSVRACYKGRVTVFEGVRRGGPVPRVSKTNQASSGKGGPALEKIGFLMFWAMWSPNCYIYRRSPLFWTLLLPVLCVCTGIARSFPGPCGRHFFCLNSSLRVKQASAVRVKQASAVRL